MAHKKPGRRKVNISKVSTRQDIRSFPSTNVTSKVRSGKMKRRRKK
jgi:hypothetical protein